jgi:hypothetical protein
MDEMAVNVKQRSAVVFGMDDVFVPEFVVKGASHRGSLVSVQF